MWRHSLDNKCWSAALKANSINESKWVLCTSNVLKMIYKIIHYNYTHTHTHINEYNGLWSLYDVHKWIKKTRSNFYTD